MMNARDLSDPAVARELAHKVLTLERLKYLVLLTYADISAVNPEAMTPWRLEQLWRTYIIAHRELTRDLENERIDEEELDERHGFLAGFPTRYIRTHTEDEIQAHLELARRSEATGVAVDLRRVNGPWLLTVITQDRRGLFADLTGTLAAFGMNIVKVEAFANLHDTVLDTFVFEDPMRTLELNPVEIDRIRKLVQRAVLGKEDVGRLLQGRRGPVAATKRARLQPTVAFDNGASNAATLVEIVANDRPGLLYDLARTFADANCSIDVVLIDTEAHKAIDVFYVTRNGVKIENSVQEQLREALLAVCSS
jgi:[protein-PII] uridylyltransferase